MKSISPDNWLPKGIDELEASSWEALKENASVCVIAGPGAGKTELLAQKAAYLLETRKCPPNQKILAISFKTDAAKNLANRVNERCLKEFSNRFVSMTFDAFTKSILDRFRLALPAEWRPSKQYKISFPNAKVVNEFLSETYNKYYQSEPEIIDSVGYLRKNCFQFESSFIGKFKLGSSIEPNSYNYIYNDWIKKQIHQQGHSVLSFMVINRLAEYIIRKNDHLRRALKATYPVVFIDEFQDTTYGQYSFLKSAFDSKVTKITAVGDFKQRIMGWAGAKDDVFSQFEIDFKANQYELICNHRSSLELVKIQNHISHVIDHQVRDVTTQVENIVDGDSSWICKTKIKDQEIRYIAEHISLDINKRALKPKDYVILVKQKANDYANEFVSVFSEYDIKLCNADEKIGIFSLQDLLSEELVILFSNILKLGNTKRLPKVWTLVSEQLELIWGINENDKITRKQKEVHFDDFINHLRSQMKKPYNKENLLKVFNLIIEFLELDELSKKSSYIGNREHIIQTYDALNEHYILSFDLAKNWGEFIDEFDKTSHVQIMTIHKSKGLEFDTVFFVGFDDSAWWSFTKDRDEGLRVFFVALSRAKQKAIFSHCSDRGRTDSISELFDILRIAGVSERYIEDKVI